MDLIDTDITTIRRFYDQCGEFRKANFKNNVPVLILNLSTGTINIKDHLKHYYDVIVGMNNCKYFTYSICNQSILVTAYDYNPEIVTINSCISGKKYAIKINFLDLISKEPMFVFRKGQLCDYYSVVYTLSKITGIENEDISDIFPKIILPKLCEMLDINIGHRIKPSKSN